MTVATQWSTLVVLAGVILVGLLALKGCVWVLLNQVRMAPTRAEQAQWFDGVTAAVGRARQLMFVLIWMLYLSFSTSRASFGSLVFYGALYLANRMIRADFNRVWQRLSHLDGRGAWRGTLDASESSVVQLGYVAYFLLIFFDGGFWTLAGIAAICYAVVQALANIRHLDLSELAVWRLADEQQERAERLGLEPDRVFQHTHMPEPIRALPGGYVAIAPSVLRRLGDDELKAAVDHEFAREPHLQFEKRLRVFTYLGWFIVAVLVSRRSLQAPGLLSVEVFAMLVAALAATFAVNSVRRKQQVRADQIALEASDDPAALGRAFERMVDVWFDPLVVNGVGELSWWDRMSAIGYAPAVTRPAPRRAVSVAGTLAVVTVAVTLAAGMVMPVVSLLGSETAREVSIGTGRAPGSSVGGVIGAFHDVLRGRSPIDDEVLEQTSVVRFGEVRELDCGTAGELASEFGGVGGGQVWVVEDGQMVLAVCN